MWGTTELTIAAVATGLVGAAVPVAGTWRRDRRWIVLLASAGAVVGGSTVAGAAAVALMESDMFTAAHFVYLVAVVGLPLVGVGFAAGWARRRGARSLLVTGGALLLPAPLGFYATHVAPFRLHVDRAVLSVPDGRASDDPLRIGVLADLQLTEVTGHEHRAVDLLMAERPHIILIAGDMHQGSVDDYDAALDDYRALLRRLDAPGGVFVVPGDVDQREGSLARLVEETGVELLEDEVRRVEVGGATIVLGGLRLDWRTPSARAVHAELAAAADDELAILLAHRPDAVLDLAPDSRVDLVVAGHTHGGQIALPVVGPPVTLSDVPRKVAAGGLHEVEGNAIYVSTGVGMERGGAPQVRFLTRPSVGLLEVRPDVP